MQLGSPQQMKNCQVYFRGAIIDPFPFQEDEPEWELVEKHAPAMASFFVGALPKGIFVFGYVFTGDPSFMSVPMRGEALDIWREVRGLYLDL